MMSTIMCLLIFNCVPIKANAGTVTLTKSQIQNYFNGRVGEGYASGYCLKFVKECWTALGATTSSACCASKYGDGHIILTSSTRACSHKS